MEGFKFIREIFQNELNNLNCCMVANITSIDTNTKKVSVKPLHKVFIENRLVELPIIQDVPLFQFMTSSALIELPFAIGDIVLLVFADYDIQNLVLTGELSEVNTNDIHSLNDAVALPLGLNPINTTLSRNTKIVIKSNGDVVVETTGDIFLGSESASSGIPFGDSLKTWIDSHVHSVPSAGNTGTPTTESPNPSTKVFVG